jgi:hypothetical protein
MTMFGPPGPGQQRTNLLNVFRFTVSTKGAFPVLARKVLKRFRDGRGRYSVDKNSAWIREHGRPSADYAKERDPVLWDEALEFGTQLKARADPIIASLPFEISGGGDYEFLYWLTRKLKPDVVVETGVAAGWSAQAFLAGMEKNGSGHLYSSDYPLFRVADPERYIGILVDPALKHRWTLYTIGDERALPEIAGKVSEIGIFHYDSDKSVSGRDFAVKTIEPKLKGPLIMDDIKDNSWFREFVEERQLDFDILGRAGMVTLVGEAL